MLIQPTIEKLYAMRLRGMAEAFQQQQEDANIHSLSFEERLGLLIDRQWNWCQNRALDRRLRNGRLQGPACIEDIDYRAPRGLDRQMVRSLTAESAWVREHQHLFLTGPTGVGKTWLARAFGHKACRDGYTALFLKAAELSDRSGPGCGNPSICSCPGRRAWARLGWPGRLGIRPAAMATPRYSSKPRNCFANSPWHAPTAAMPSCSTGSAGSIC